MTIALALAMTATAGLAVPFVVTAAQAGVPAAPTFTKDIAPILQRSCETCHRPGSVAAMLQQHTKILSFEPHLHAPGARMCLEAIWGFNRISPRTTTSSAARCA